MSLRLLFEFPFNPNTLGPIQNCFNVRLVRCEWAIVKIGSVVKVARVTLSIHLNIEHPARYDASVSCFGRGRVLDAVLKIKQEARCVARIALVHQYCPTSQKIAMPFKSKIQHSIEKWMTRTDKRREWLTLGCYERFFEDDALVPLQHRLTHAN
jgi:hypothetical protein